MEGGTARCRITTPVLTRSRSHDSPALYPYPSQVGVMDELAMLRGHEEFLRAFISGSGDSHREELHASLDALCGAIPATADKPLTGRDGLDIDTLWEAIAASLTVAETHKTAIYRGEGVQPADALSGIEKHIAAGLAARVMYERLRTATTEEPDGRL
jgi:hypothetical protein